MNRIAQSFGVALGYIVGLRSDPRGCNMRTVIEILLTIDRSMPRPDHKVCLEPDQFGAMVSVSASFSLLSEIALSGQRLARKPTNRCCKGRACRLEGFAMRIFMNF